jgi:hypothetical protein
LKRAGWADGASWWCERTPAHARTLAASRSGAVRPRRNGVFAISGVEELLSFVDD